MISAKNHIKDWLEIVAKRGHLEKQDIVFMMVQTRHLIEDCDNSSRYRTIEFYCDWIVHAKIDRPSEIRLAIFRDITNALSEHWKSDAGAIPIKISKIIGLSSLKKELICLFQINKLNIGLFSDDENWKIIIGSLTYFLQNKPIVFPNGETTTKSRFKDSIKDIMNLKKPADFWIKNLSIIGINNRPHWCFELGGEKDTTKIVGELFITKESGVKIIKDNKKHQK